MARAQNSATDSNCLTSNHSVSLTFKKRATSECTLHALHYFYTNSGKPFILMSTQLARLAHRGLSCNRNKSHSRTVKTSPTHYYINDLAIKFYSKCSLFTSQSAINTGQMTVKYVSLVEGQRRLCVTQFFVSK